jgi:hypothetical protein
MHRVHYLQKLALASPTSGSGLVSIARSQAKVTELLLLVIIAACYTNNKLFGNRRILSSGIQCRVLR